MKAIVILATICFFWATTYTSTIRAEETEEAWKIVEEGPNKGSYKGKFWDLDALLSLSDDQNFFTITVNQQYSSEEAAVKTCERVAEKLISQYGLLTKIRQFNKKVNISFNGHTFNVRTPCLILLTRIKSRKRVRSKRQQFVQRHGRVTPDMIAPYRLFVCRFFHQSTEIRIQSAVGCG